MDVPLEDLGAVSEALTRGEEAAAEQAWTTARDALAEVDAGLEAARAAWRDADEGGRRMIGAVAGPLRRRRDALAARLPPVRAVSEGAPVADPEQDDEPDAAAGDAGSPARGPGAIS